VSLDLAFDDAQQAIVDGIAQFCRDRCPDDVVKQATGKFPAEQWRELAELGVLALVTPEGDGGAMEMVAALEALGAAVFPGPLPATFFATQVLPEADRVAVARGDAVASVGVPPLMPWAPAAHLFLALERGRVWKGSPRGEIEPVETLGGEPWGRLELERESDLGPADRARVIYEIALAAYLAAAGRRLVDDTAEHARTRKQFGRAIGEFQAVAHPLADCSIQLGGAATLARAAAFRFDDAGEGARATAAAARLAAARASVATARIGHQLFGAIGITLEGPVFHVSRRIRQLVSQPPGEGEARDVLLADFGL
jgi:alkylation response protein AidB-like acyl-CoA dehydrogenase